MKVLQYMDPPPPVGGVTISVKNLHESLIAVGQQSFYKREFSQKEKYDIGHIHASNVYKRLLQIILLKLFCKKVIFTVHGLWLEDTKINRLTLSLADGVVLLNNKLYQKWKGKVDTNLVVLPSLFKEGAPQRVFEEKEKGTKTTVLLYSHSKIFKEGQEVYGIDFALKALSEQPDLYKVILVDLDAGYQDLVTQLSAKIEIEYHPKTVDFAVLLAQCDIYLRPTCMDGSSVAIQEALLQGKRVIASDVVDRGTMVEVYDHLNAKSLSKTLNNRVPTNQDKFSLTSVDAYLSFIDSL